MAGIRMQLKPLAHQRHSLAGHGGVRAVALTHSSNARPCVHPVASKRPFKAGSGREQQNFMHRQQPSGRANTMSAAKHRPLVFTCFTVQLWAHAVTASMLSLQQQQQQPLPPVIAAMRLTVSHGGEGTALGGGCGSWQAGSSALCVQPSSSWVKEQA